MFQQGLLDELAKMYRIFKRVESSLVHITDKLKIYISARGTQITQDPALGNEPLELIQKLLDFKEEIDHLVKYSFKNDKKFEIARDHTFISFLNAFENIPWFLAEYVDNQLRKELKNATTDQAQTKISAIMNLFVYINDRDVFLMAYQKQLAIRLLKKTFVSQEAEEFILSRLKIECGVHQMGKISGMF